MLRKSSLGITTLIFVLLFNTSASAGLWSKFTKAVGKVWDVVVDVAVEAADCLTSPIDCVGDQIDGIKDMGKVCEDVPIGEFVNFPMKIKDTVSYVGGDTLGFFFNDVCAPEELKVTRLQERVKYYWDGKSNYLDKHWHCNFRIIRVDYEVTCSNKLAYPGIKYLFSYPWSREGYKEASASEAQEHDWIDMPLDFLGSDGSITKDPTDSTEWNRKPRRLDVDALKLSWKGQAVDLPSLYLGGPGMLPYPVLLVHGLESDFIVWGVEAKSKNRDSSDFKEGLVKKYNTGTLPDLLSKSYNLSISPDSINHNGIYFYQAPSTKIDDKWQENSIIWNAKNSQPKYLYEKIEFVLSDYFGDKWKNSEVYKIDLVVHSQGGLVVREMLRGLRENTGGFGELENAANHINRVITVNTPHFGSSLAAENMNDIIEKYPGLALIINDLDNPKKHSLVEAKVDLSFWKDRGAGLISPNWYWYLLGFAPNIVSSFIGPD